MVTAAMKIKDTYLLLGRKVVTNLDSIIKRQKHYYANKGPASQSYVWMESCMDVRVES